MDKSVSTRVVLAVAERKDVEPTALPPLARTLDPDALGALFDSRAESERPTGDRCVLEFTYAGRLVRIDDGDVSVSRVRATPESSAGESHPKG